MCECRTSQYKFIPVDKSVIDEYAWGSVCLVNDFSPFKYIQSNSSHLFLCISYTVAIKHTHTR